MLLRGIFTWAPMAPIVIANGALREAVYGKRARELAAHQISTATGALLLGAYMFAVTRFWKLESSGEALELDAVWLILTIAFEFLFGRYVMGHGWGRMLRDNNIFAGRVWAFLPVWIAAAPWVLYRP